MDIQPQSQQAISDDQELAKVLAGVNQQADQAAAADAAEEKTSKKTKKDEAKQAPAENADDPGYIETPAPEAAEAEEAPQEPVAAPEAPAPEVPAPEAPAPAPEAPAPAAGNLDAVKQEALGELRPLVDKLEVSPEEKFDTYLLLLRSTDDTALIEPAHESARAITDEARRAQALLDIIKEIDYLTGSTKPAA